MLKLPTFDQSYVRAKSTGGKISVLLGNGFSIGACPEFANASLWAPFEQILASQGLLPLRLPGDDFGPEQAPIVEWPPRAQPRGMQANDNDAARSQAFVEAVTRIHPLGRQQVSEEMLCGAAKFVSKFDNVFTTNYDLLAYWVCMHLLSGECDSHIGLARIRDGFQPTRSSLPDWEPLIYHAASIAPKMIHYLHGALHLFRVPTTGGSAATMKLARAARRTLPRLRSGSIDQMRMPSSLLEQVEDQIRAGWYPLCVVGDSSEKKVAVIESSDYLSAARDRLRSARGHLFTYGWSFDDADRHIVSSILGSGNFDSASVGVYGDGDGLIERIAKYAERNVVRTRIDFFDAESVDVWGIDSIAYDPAPNVLSGSLPPLAAL